MVLNDGDVLATALAWLGEGRTAATAVVVSTWGSSPRPVGSLMAVDGSGAIVGSVTSGCVENAVIEEALGVIRDGKPRLLSYGVTSERAWEVGLTCGGTVGVLVVPLDDARVARAALVAVADKRPVARVVNVRTGARSLVGLDGVEIGDLPDEVAEAAVVRLRDDDPGMIERGDERWFVHVHFPPRRVIVVGAVHIAQAMVPFARALDYEMIVVDPRGSFATRERFPDVELLRMWPDEAFAELRLGPRDSVVTLAHDVKIDDPALEIALRSEAFHVGALGSRANQAKRRERLLAAGLAPEQVAKLRGPVGLSIGAKSPAEIALSILAEITVFRRGATA